MPTPIPLLQKMRMLAGQNATIQGYCLGSNGTFRWFDTQLPKGYVAQGTTVVVRQLSTITTYAQNGPTSLEEALVELSVWDMDSVVAKALAAYLVTNWFPAVDFVSDNMFLSPPGPALASPNFRVSQQGIIDYDVQPVEVWREILTYRIWNNITL